MPTANVPTRTPASLPVYAGPHEPLNMTLCHLLLYIRSSVDQALLCNFCSCRRQAESSLSEEASNRRTGSYDFSCVNRPGLLLSGIAASHSQAPCSVHVRDESGGLGFGLAWRGSAPGSRPVWKSPGHRITSQTLRSTVSLAWISVTPVPIVSSMTLACLESLRIHIPPAADTRKLSRRHVHLGSKDSQSGPCSIALDLKIRPIETTQSRVNHARINQIAGGCARVGGSLPC